MERHRHRSIFVLVSIALFLAIPTLGFTALMNLNTFTADPTVAVSANGQSAVFTEDQYISPVSLLLIPFVVPGNALSLSFDYNLAVAPGNEDYFHAKLFDLGTGDSLTGFDLGDVGGLEGTHAGPTLWDLTSLRGQSVGLVFDLGYGYDDFGLESVLTVSNVDLSTSVTPVPEPGTLMLMVSGLGGLGWVSRKKMFKRS